MPSANCSPLACVADYGRYNNRCDYAHCCYCYYLCVCDDYDHDDDETYSHTT